MLHVQNFSCGLIFLLSLCRCSGSDKNSYLWHNYRPLSEKLEDMIESVVQEYVDKDCVVVSAAASLDKFIQNRGLPVCRDQFLRLAMVPAPTCPSLPRAIFSPPCRACIAFGMHVQVPL